MRKQMMIVGTLLLTVACSDAEPEMTASQEIVEDKPIEIEEEQIEKEDEEAHADEINIEVEDKAVLELGKDEIRTAIDEYHFGQNRERELHLLYVEELELEGLNQPHLLVYTSPGQMDSSDLFNVVYSVNEVEVIAFEEGEVIQIYSSNNQRDVSPLDDHFIVNNDVLLYTDVLQSDSYHIVEVYTAFSSTGAMSHTAYLYGIHEYDPSTQTFVYQQYAHTFNDCHDTYTTECGPDREMEDDWSGNEQYQYLNDVFVNEGAGLHENLLKDVDSDKEVLNLSYYVDENIQTDYGIGFPIDSIDNVDQLDMDYFTGGAFLYGDHLDASYFYNEVSETINGYMIADPSISIFGAHIGMNLDELNEHFPRNARSETFESETSGYIYVYNLPDLRVTFWADEYDGPATMATIIYLPDR
ncbi:hypothetical protein ACE1TF_13705 [Geomicrobium sp. JSM 1781026]|uniref:hypothetical protein n=1 Tax=Geomicrobium sp. JSM 1781026 TaxID=3344580 RepID=UPI0035BF9C26